MEEIWIKAKYILAWFFGVIAILLGLFILFNDCAIIGKIVAVFMIIIGLYIIPKINQLISYKASFTNLAIVYSICFIGLIAVAGNKTKNETTNTLYYSTVDNLNVRENNNKNSSILFQLKKNEKINLIVENNGWSEISTKDGRHGYVSTKYILADPVNESETSWPIIVIIFAIVAYALFKKGAFGTQFDSQEEVPSYSNAGNKSESQKLHSSSNTDKKFNSQKASSSSNTSQKHNPQNYYCEYCGQRHLSVSSLTLSSCARHPLGVNKGKHKLYEGSEKAKYTCKYCGQSFISISSMTIANCSRHPFGVNKGTHAPAL